MAYTTINKSADYFNTKLYTGNGGTLNVTGVGFQPDLVWIKGRGYADSQVLTDAVRGTTKCLSSDSTTAEFTQTNGLTAFGSDGFTLGNWSAINRASTTVAWNWKANGAGSANTDGSISSTVSANTTAGMSIVSYTGTGSASTIGHGLSSAPTMIICKNLTDSESWSVYSQSLGASAYMKLDVTDAKVSNDSSWNGVTPTSTVFSVKNDNRTNGNGDSFIAYCFADVQGYSKMGSYTGNGNADGTFVYTGFKPAFVMFKNTTGNNWGILDNKRDSYNGLFHRLIPNSSGADNTGAGVVVDFLSNGFKCRNADGLENGAAEIIYMAFAEAPLVGTNNVPCTAR